MCARCVKEATVYIESQIKWHRDFGRNEKYRGLLQYVCDGIKDLIRGR